MFKNYEVYDNFLKDPDLAVSIIERQKYNQSITNKNVKIKKNDIPLIDKKKFEDENWLGYRSNNLNQNEWNFCHSVFDSLIINMTKNLNIKNVSHRTNIFSHLMTKDFRFKESWEHEDPFLFAGVLYLSKNPEPESGTYLVINDEKIYIENVFNRFLLYKSNIRHSSQGGFGTSLKDCRKTLTIFIASIELSI